MLSRRAGLSAIAGLSCFGLGLTYVGQLLTKMCAKYDFHMFVPSDLDL